MIGREKSIVNKQKEKQKSHPDRLLGKRFGNFFSNETLSFKKMIGMIFKFDR